LINKRIGIDLFQEKLEYLSKSEYYAKALQKPQLKISKSADMLFDYEFARLYKTYENSIERMLQSRQDSLSTINLSEQQTSTVVNHYNDLIRKQDEQINRFKQQEKQFQYEIGQYQTKITNLEQNLQEIKDQYALLKISTRQG